MFLNRYLSIPCNLNPKIKMHINKNKIIDRANKMEYKISRKIGCFDAHDVL